MAEVITVTSTASGSPSVVIPVSSIAKIDANGTGSAIYFLSTAGQPTLGVTQTPAAIAALANAPLA